MVLLQATKLNLNLLPQPHSPPSLSSLLFDPHSLTLALFHSNSSLSLYPSFSPLSLSSPSPSPPQTLIPPPSSSATFLRLQSPNPYSTPRVLFLVSAPHLGGSAVLLRFWILKKSKTFAKTQIVCNQSSLKFDNNKSGVVFDINHGLSMKVVGSINVFAMYSVSNGKIWIFSAKMANDEDDDGVVVKLMRCAVIDCCFPVFSISVSFGFLILGEGNGVRVFPLRPLVKGKVRKQKHSRESKHLNGGLENEKLAVQRSNLPNGTIQRINGINDLYRGDMVTGGSTCNGNIKGKTEKHFDCVKLRALKLRQDSKEVGAGFVPFNPMDVEHCESTKRPPNSAKAVSIEALSPNKFIILDSLGDLHILFLSNHVRGSEIPSHHMKCLTHTVKVQKLAVLPDMSISFAGTPTVWVSDGHHTIHVMIMADMDTSTNKSDRKESEDKLMQISVDQVIFTGEKIQDIVPFAANAVMILGEGSIYAYGIS